MFLKQSTASQSVLIGPFVDDTDGATAETGLSIANTDIRLSANGGNMAAKNSGGGTHDENGWYQITLDATDTATVGTLQVSCKVAGALAVWADFQVVEEAIYDTHYAASATARASQASVDTIDGIVDDILVDTAEIGSAGAGLTAVPWNASWDAEVESEVADALDAAVPSTPTNNSINQRIRDLEDAVMLRRGTAQAGAAGTITLDSGASATDDFYNGLLVVLVNNTGSGQVRAITDYVGSTKVATISPDWTTNPDATTVFTLLPEGAAGTPPTAAAIADAVWDEAIADHDDVGSTGEALDAAGGGVTAASIADAVWDEAQGDHVGAGTFGEIATEIASVLVDTGTTLDGKLDTIDGIVDNILLDTAEIGTAGAGLTEAGGTGDQLTALATQASMDTVDGNVDAILVDTGTTLQAELDGIQADTEDIQSRIPAALVGGRIDASVDGTGMEAGAVGAILTTAMTEAYNTDGSAPTVAQALMVIMQRLTEFEITGTTITVNKLDGTTEAYTLTLDDESAPTSSTRAT